MACEIDLKVGGAFRFVWRGPDGTDVGMRGIYRGEGIRKALATDTWNAHDMKPHALRSGGWDGTPDLEGKGQFWVRHHYK